MLRSPLENIVLKTKMLEMGSPKSVLALAMDRPKLADIETTVLVLKELGAILHSEENPLDGNITLIGRIMASLPLDVRLTRLIIFGYFFSMLEDCIIIGNESPTLCRRHFESVHFSLQPLA